MSPAQQGLVARSAQNTMNITHVLAALAKEPEGTFLDVAQFNGAAIGACDITGRSPVWEMHPDTEEFFFIIEGTFEMTLLEANGPKTFVASAGSTFVVPQGIWHKPAAPEGAKFMYCTPGTTLHSDAADPRESTS